MFGVVDALGCFLEVGRRSFQDVDEFLGVAVGQGEPGAVNLDHDAMTVAESVVDVGQIEMLEADRNYVTLRVDNKTFHARTTLQQAAEAMGSQPMLRISRSCIVNINHVCEVSRTLRGDFVLLLRGGSTAASSQGYRHKVRAHLEHLTLGRT